MARSNALGLVASTALLLTPAVAAHARSDPAAAGAQVNSVEDDAFELGQIIVTGRRAEGIEVTGSILNAEAIYTFNRNSLDEAANLIPGVSSSNTGGSRNERLIFVRGFDRFQVPLSIDGIRVYLPADNRLDHGRFVTPDIAEIQVAKGYASVLDGPGAIGGAINLVTRTPTDAVEAEARGILSIDRDFEYGGYTGFGLIGTRRDRFYAQASYTHHEQDHWSLSGDFTPTVNEDGGDREFSDTRDWRLNVKGGFTPNDTDEYSISYTRQEGKKNAPIETTVPLPVQRYWSWPFWNLDSLYFLSTTAFGESATLKTRIYRNSFHNLLRSFDTRAQTTQTLPRAFNSYYEDDAYGGSAQIDLRLLPGNTTRVAAHYRRDRHVEFQQLFPSGFTEPRQVNEEDTYSVAVENSATLSPAFSLVLGASYDWRDLRRAEDYGTPPGGGPARVFGYPIADADAWNGQGRLVWSPDAQTRVSASVSSRTRFPTIFERFSSRFGGATSNPGLAAERAVNYEIEGSRNFGRLRLESALFYSSLDDVIVAVPLIFNGQAVTQSGNLGSGEYYGGEIAVAANVSRTLTLGGNYTYTRRKLDDPSNSAFQPTGVPTHKGFAYADWKPLDRMRVVSSVDMASDRWVSNTAGTRYFRTGSFVQLNFRMDYELNERVEVGIGARNVLDGNYELADGFPEAGRSFFASVRARY